MNIVEEELTKGVIRIRKSTKGKTIAQREKTTIYKTLLRKLKMGQSEPLLKTGVISGASRISSSCSTSGSRRNVHLTK
jgi:hypothetical protein